MWLRADTRRLLAGSAQVPAGGDGVRVIGFSRKTEFFTVNKSVWMLNEAAAGVEQVVSGAAARPRCRFISSSQSERCEEGTHISFSSSSVLFYGCVSG